MSEDVQLLEDWIAQSLDLNIVEPLWWELEASDPKKTTQPPRNFGNTAKKNGEKIPMRSSGPCFMQYGIKLRQLFGPKSARQITNLHTLMFCIFCNKLK